MLVGLALIAAVPSSAAAATYEFFEVDFMSPSQNAATSGPSTTFPSTITVTGLQGTVTNVTASLIGLRSSSGDDIDAVLTNPGGDRVMLVSDACGVFGSIDTVTWIFDDDAPGYLSNNGPCFTAEDLPFKPSNYLGGSPEPDDLSPFGGPAPPYVNAMSFLAGGSPNGTWSLFMLDDDAGAGIGFDLPAWSLKLEVTPPPAAPEPPPTKKAKCKKGKGKAGGKSAAKKKRCKKGKKK